MNIKIYPIKDYLISFLQARGFKIVDESPQVLHYFGTDRSELKKLLEKDKPDLVITHTVSFLYMKDVKQVFHLLEKPEDLFRLTEIFTNSYELCKQYYRRLGLQERITTIPGKSKRKLKTFNINKLNNIFAGWQKFRIFMRWE